MKFVGCVRRGGGLLVDTVAGCRYPILVEDRSATSVRAGETEEGGATYGYLKSSSKELANSFQKFCRSTEKLVELATLHQN